MRLDRKTQRVVRLQARIVRIYSMLSAMRSGRMTIVLTVPLPHTVVLSSVCWSKESIVSSGAVGVEGGAGDLQQHARPGDVAALVNPSERTPASMSA